MAAVGRLDSAHFAVPWIRATRERVISWRTMFSDFCPGIQKSGFLARRDACECRGCRKRTDAPPAPTQSGNAARSNRRCPYFREPYRPLGGEGNCGDGLDTVIRPPNKTRSPKFHLLQPTHGKRGRLLSRRSAPHRKSLLRFFAERVYIHRWQQDGVSCVLCSKIYSQQKDIRVQP